VGFPRRWLDGECLRDFSNYKMQLGYSKPFRLIALFLQVKLGLYEVASELYRVHPYVYNTPDNSAVICFSGYLSNLQELARAYSGNRSPKSPVARMVNEAYSLERKSSIERSMDVGALTASVVLELYQTQKEGQELIMLSELQVSTLPSTLHVGSSWHAVAPRVVGL
jgi:hypothetical protein